MSGTDGRTEPAPDRHRLPRHLLRKAAPLLAAALLLLDGGPALARSYPNIFGSKEISSSNWSIHTGPIVQWNGMLKRWANGTPCKESNTCTTKGWTDLVAKVKAAGSPMAEIKLANSLMNDPAQHPYIEDINNWGQQEYWATAYQFLRKSGDCEDFSIAKYMLLKAAGMPVEDMRVVAVRIRSLGGIGHAILVVYQGNTALVLDNRNPKVLDASLVAVEFQPILSLNEQFWWLHLPGG
jgi:predicted transglutaminase-like cysteine proteinase